MFYRAQDVGNIGEKKIEVYLLRLKKNCLILILHYLIKYL